MFILARSIHDKVTAGVQSIRRCVGGAGRMHVYFRLVALLLALGGAGCLLIQSATRGMASQSCFSRLQMVWLLFGLIFLSACFLFPRSFYKRHLGVILGLIYALLWGVLVFGVKIQGARSWYRFHGFCMQPSELAAGLPGRLCLVLEMVGKMAESEALCCRVLFAGLWMLPIMLQPDWGTTMIYALTTLVLLYCWG